MTPTIRWKPRDIKQIKIERQEHDQIKKWKEKKRKEKIGGDQKKVKKVKKKTAINRLFLMLWATHFISLNNLTNMFHNRAYFVCSSSDSNFINLVLIIFVVRSYLSSYRMRNGSRLTPNILFGGGQTQDLIIPNENVAPRNKNAFERHVAAMK